MTANRPDRVVLIDGGLSTELEHLGFGIKDTALWTARCLIDNADLLKKAHINSMPSHHFRCSFLRSGCEIIETSSYQMSVDSLCAELSCTVDEALSLVRRSVQVANEARKEEHLESSALIAGSIGPYGACLCDGSEFRGDYALEMSIQFLVEWHRPRFEALLAANCDLLAFETVPSIKEATALVGLLREHPTAKAWLSFSCKNESELCNGDSFRQAFSTFKGNEQLVAIGINCTRPQYVAGLLQSLEWTISDTPLIVYTNDGKIWDPETSSFRNDEDSTQNGSDPLQIVLDLIPTWIALGVSYIGGCCNISAKDMARICNKIRPDP